MTRTADLPILVETMACAECGSEWPDGNECPSCGPRGIPYRYREVDGGELAADAWAETAGELLRNAAAKETAA